MKLKLFTAALLIICVRSISAQQYDGWTLYSTMGGTNTYLLDTNGTVQKTWTTTGKSTGYSSYLIPGGTLVRTVKASGVQFTGGPICGEVEKRDYNNNVLWDFVYSTYDYCTHHDICPMPNGNVLLIAYERKTAAQVTAAGCTSYSQESWPEKIVEVKPTGATTGTIVWEWHFWDHLVQNTNASLANYQTSIVNHPELLNVNLMNSKDWIHMNGVDYNPMLDQITFSCHNLNEVFVIDHSTTTAEAASHSGGNSGKGGDLLYRWGKPSNYQASGTTIINVCHDAHWIKEGLPHANYLAYYNNNGISTSQSCGDMFMPPVTGYNYSLTLGQQYLPTTYAVRQATGGYNSNMGNIQELPNGNRLLAQATAGVIKEFNSAGTLLWSFTAAGSVPKAFRYNSCYINNAAPAIPTITENIPGTLSSSSATTYQWYLNGQPVVSATNQDYVVTQDGIYVVRITDANGCVYVYSVGYHYTTPTGIVDAGNISGVNIYPNPSSGLFFIENSSLKGEYTVAVYNSVGKLVNEGRNVSSLDISTCASGIYYVRINSQAGILNTKISIVK
jgi:hypothetical protein